MLPVPVVLPVVVGEAVRILRHAEPLVSVAMSCEIAEAKPQVS